MTRPRLRALVPVALLLLAQALLAAGGADGAGALRSWLPAGARLVLAFAALLMVPGYALLRLTARPPGGAWFSAGWALGLGVAWNGLLILATRAAGLPFTVLAGGSAVTSAALWAIALARPGTGQRGSAGETPVAGAGLAVWIAAAVALLFVWRVGPPFSYYSDTPDHVGTIRRMLQSGDAFPLDAFFKGAGGAGADPRKGLWHPLVALVCRLAAVDPIEAWRQLSALLAGCFVLNAAALGMLLGGPIAAAVAGWALLLTYGGSLAHPALREAVFATKLADQLALATTVAVLADVAAPSRGRRVAVVGLGWGAFATHVFPALQFAVTFGALGLGLALRDGRRAFMAGSALRRLSATVAWLALAGLPYLLWRAGHAYAPRSIIHTEPQGLLLLAPGVWVVSIGVLWDWMGRLWVLFPLAWPWLWRGRANPAVLSLLTTSLAAGLIMFAPPAVALLQPRLGYLLMRFIWLAPLAGLLGWMIPALVRRALRRPTAGRWAALAALVLTGFFLRPVVLAGVRCLVHPERVLYEERVQNTLRWRDVLDELDRRVGAGNVVLSDPATSYAVPLLTRQYVVTLVDQHSSPNDAQALQRIVDARDALDPYARWARTREVVRRYGVDLVVLNGRFEEIPHLDYWAPGGEWFKAARARLDAEPRAFVPVLDHGDFVAYRVERAALDTLSSAPRPRLFVLPYSPGRFPPARSMGAGLPALLDLSLGRRAAAPGDTVEGVARWRALEALPPGSYHVPVRFDRIAPGSRPPVPFLAKPWRKVHEQARGERYRFRMDHLPVGGDYGVDLWRPDQVVCDTFSFIVPRDVASGDYQVRLRMIRQPHYPIYRLHDYLHDDDYYSGLPAGRLLIVPAIPRSETPPAAHPSASRGDRP